jgi:MFS family permease
VALLKYLAAQKRFYISHILGFSLFAVVSTGYATWGPSFLIRTFHWPVQKVGLVLGLISLVGGVTGGLASGWIADFFFRRGVRDAHLRLYVWVTLAVGVTGIVGGLSHNVPTVMISMATEKFLIPFIAVAATALQITTPNQYRGQVSAIFLFFYNIVGFGFGASFIAGISDFWLGGPQHIGKAIAIAFAIICPLASIIFALGLKPMRRAVDATAVWESGPDE